MLLLVVAGRSSWAVTSMIAPHDGVLAGIE